VEISAGVGASPGGGSGRAASLSSGVSSWAIAVGDSSHVADDSMAEAVVSSQRGVCTLLCACRGGKVNECEVPAS